jgi:hypothetical protein
MTERNIPVSSGKGTPTLLLCSLLCSYNSDGAARLTNVEESPVTFVRIRRLTEYKTDEQTILFPKTLMRNRAP